MIPFRPFLISSALLAASLGDSSTSCPDGRCAVAPSPTVEWRRRSDAPGEAYLFIDGVQAGGYNRARDEWRDFDGRAWSAPRPLFAAPDFRGVEVTSASGPVRNYGLELDKLPTHDGRYSLCGRTVTRSEALQALAVGEPFRDDSQLLRVTIIGTPAQRQLVLDDFDRDSALRAWKSRALVSALTPDNPRIRDAGFKTDGTPTIYVQAPSGQVLHRQDEYRGSEPLAEALEIADRRRKDPNYDPSKDPDLNRRTSDNSIRVRTWHLYLGAGLLLALLLRRKAP